MGNGVGGEKKEFSKKKRKERERENKSFISSINLCGGKIKVYDNIYFIEWENGNGKKKILFIVLGAQILLENYDGL